jgi:hypothetical protein
MVERMRATIHALGGDIRFQCKVVDIDVDERSNGAAQVRAVVLESGETIAADHVVLAVGHSARDTFRCCTLAASISSPNRFRSVSAIEHPQSMIDRKRYGKSAGHPLLARPTTNWSITAKTAARSTASACARAGRLWQPLRSRRGRDQRDEPVFPQRAQRQRGIVVGITPADYPGHALAGIDFQRHWEERAFDAGGRNYDAPAQLVGDFIAGRPSTSLALSCLLYAGRAHDRPQHLRARLRGRGDTRSAARVRPADQRLREARCRVDRVETRTSSPIRITRNRDYQSINTVASIRRAKARLRGRHSFRSGGRHRSGRSRGAEHHG